MEVSSQRHDHYLPWVSIGLTIWCVVVAAKIEYLNACSGYLLPRVDDGIGNHKWRVSVKRANGQGDLQELSEAQLREAVSGAGLLQYLFAPTALVLCLISGRRSLNRLWLTVVLVFSGGLAAACAYLALSRDYLGSLGW